MLAIEGLRKASGGGPHQKAQSSTVLEDPAALQVFLLKHTRGGSTIPNDLDKNGRKDEFSQPPLKMHW